MAANRKLQTEIQQVLKKVDEGVELFDEIWGKVYAAEQQSLKEKYENDLKKEIKKLQRLRDQIKSWISSSDIKDKAQLVEARKTIESKMEMFKVCEKDTKTKAYSKEGLAREARIDPKDQLKEEKRVWLNDCLDKLHDLNTIVDGEKEKVSTGKNKLKNKEALERLENRLQKHKWHISRIELIIRLLENDELDPSLLDSIKDSLEYYLETAADDDGGIGVEDEFDIYEDLQLDQYVNTFDVAKNHSADHNINIAEMEKEVDEAIPKLSSTKVVTQIVKSTADSAKSNVRSDAKIDMDEAKAPVKLPAVEADAVEAKQVPVPKSVKHSDAPMKLIEATSPSPLVFAQVNTSVQPITVAPAASAQIAPPMVSPVPAPIPSTVTPPPLVNQGLISGQQMNNELQTVYNLLKQSHVCNIDNEADRSSYVPKNYYGGCHNSFPTAPAISNQSEMAGLYDKLPLDTLFFGFYYQQNSSAQFLCAKRLKKSSWRFHKKYTTWFQRHSEPKISAADYEDGSYVYFDYESGWCQRIKSDFKFEYAFLEDEI